MAKIIINHLGAISQLEIDIKQFNLLIGEQATGKSTICKAIYFFRLIKDEITNVLYTIAKQNVRTKFLNTVNGNCKALFIGLFGYSQALPKDLLMKYEISKNTAIEISINDKYINITFSNKMLEQLLHLEKEARNYHDNIRTYDDFSYGFASTENLRYYQEIRKKVNKIFQDDMETYYIPAGRSLLTLMTNQKTKLDYDTIDLVNRKFMQFIENIQPKFSDGISNVHKYFTDDNFKFNLKEIIEQIVTGLKGEYYFNKSKEFLKVPATKEKIPINFISSGQQEILWLFNQLYILLLRNEKSFVIIEEPEAHLYPSLQKNVVDFIAQFMNITGSTIFVTTHSPYILNNVNNLYYAGRLIKKYGFNTEIEKVIPKYNYIAPDKIQACKLSHNSLHTVCNTLIDSELKEISTEAIDEISNSINEIYTKLYYAEEKLENKG